MDPLRLQSDQLVVTISPHGAEMHSLRSHAGDEYLWQAEPAIWGRHAPHLFPIVGRLNNDTLYHLGRAYPMAQHGFARDLPFTLDEATTRHCQLSLRSNAMTREKYPFEFVLAVEYSLLDQELTIRYTVHNLDEAPLPCSVGAHPAFNWPQPGNPDRQACRIVFEHEEFAPVARLAGGLIVDSHAANPLQGKILKLEDALFEDDAIIFTRHNSRRVRLEAPGSKPVTVTFADFPHLGIWSIPGAGFVCIEPWQGHADPAGYTGEFMDKPGVVHIAPGQTRSWQIAIRIGD
ncbi:MAG: aldose 1-epimerase family protein [Granulosicoccaceae bacterium]|jgi:galactose mutarotase-like enzyme